MARIAVIVRWELCR